MNEETHLKLLSTFGARKHALEQYQEGLVILTQKKATSSSPILAEKLQSLMVQIKEIDKQMREEIGEAFDLYEQLYEAEANEDYLQCAQLRNLIIKI